MSRPLLFLDVDGPLNPYAAKPERRPDGYTTIRASVRPGRPLRVWLHPGHGAALLRLPYELVWATTWMSLANRWIAPVVGLPDLPHVDFGPDLLAERTDGVHWKTETLVAHAAGRPFAWVDDELTPTDTDFVTTHHPAPALLHHVSPRVGLREEDFEALREFARGLGGGFRGRCGSPRLPS
ncbi:HAD domain-containing protein [Streptomyces sp. NPDC005811]|uniref:HAD domain-containing protein n=1 Tax=Streptomyces sp. NPDC005811 TaxID=3154565 RepID=UPI0033D9D120